MFTKIKHRVTLSFIMIMMLCVGGAMNVWAQTHYLAFASDRHGKTAAIGSAMGGMPSTVEYVSLIGDMVDGSNQYNSSTVLSEVQGVFTGLSASNVSIVYGSHDTNCTDGAGILKCKGDNTSDLIYTGLNTDGSVAYYVYGVAFQDMDSDDAQSTSTAATKFMNWVATITDHSIPIIVVSHMPLHASRGDNGYAVAWSKALNYAATGEETTESGKEITRDVIFLHGHNHTTESNKEFFVPRGSTMQIFSSSYQHYTYYTYTTAGYLKENPAATLLTIDDSKISFTKYRNRVETNTYSTYSFATPSTTTAATHTIARVVTKPQPTMAEMADMTTTWSSGWFVLQDTPTPSVSYEGETIEGTFTYASNNADVATVDEYGKVTIVGPGTAVITVTFPGNDKYAPVHQSYTINVRQMVEKTVYELVDALTVGKNYQW